MLVTLWPYSRLGSEFMPPLEEGDLLYMPTTDPSISIGKARELLQQTDKLIKTFPEVDHVFGKAGRAETSTDPARSEHVGDDHCPEAGQIAMAHPGGGSLVLGTARLAQEHRWPTSGPRRGRSPTTNSSTAGTNRTACMCPGLDDVVKIPGLTNAWTMPIKTRIDMLSTGIKTPIGIKVGGSDLNTLAELSGKIASQLRTLPDTVSVYSEKTIGGYYVDFKVKRAEAARYGMNVQDVQDVILTALGGMNVTTTVEGLERYPVNVRYPRELRDDLTKLKRTLIAAPSGAQIPIEQVTELVVHTGPPVIRSEQARPNAWIYVDISTSDIGGYVRRAQELVQQNVIDQPDFPPATA